MIIAIYFGAEKRDKINSFSGSNTQSLWILESPKLFIYIEYLSYRTQHIQTIRKADKVRAGKWNTENT